MNLVRLTACCSLLLGLAFAASFARADGTKPPSERPAAVEAGKAELPQRWDRLERRTTDRATERAERARRPQAPGFPPERR